jgi:histidine triad (HIT) family protein
VPKSSAKQTGEGHLPSSRIRDLALPESDLVALDCIFCRISSGEAPADLVYRDDDVMAFLPLTLQATAHVVVAPRRHACAIWDLEPILLGKTTVVAREIASRMRAVGATGINLLHASGVDAQQSVPHFHLHVLARYPADGLDAWPRLPDVPVDREQLVRQLVAEGRGPEPRGFGAGG